MYRAKGGAVLAIKTEITNIVIIQNSTFIGNNNTTFLNNSGAVKRFGGTFIYMLSNCVSQDTTSLDIHNATFDGNTEGALHIYTNILTLK